MIQFCHFHFLNKKNSFHGYSRFHQENLPSLHKSLEYLPYFDIQNNSLVLRGVPIESDPSSYFKKNPPDINSYLFRRFLYSDLNFFPDAVNRKLKKWDEYGSRKIELNRMVLLNTLKDLRKNDHDFIFLIFHYL